MSRPARNITDEDHPLRIAAKHHAGVVTIGPQVKAGVITHQVSAATCRAMVRRGLLEHIHFGTYRITELGRAILQTGVLPAAPYKRRTLRNATR